MAEKKMQLKDDKVTILQKYHQDGILDIIAGVVILNYGMDIGNQAVSTSLFTWLPILLLTSMKNRTTLPRMDLMGYPMDEKLVRKWNLILTVGIAATVVIMGLFSFSSAETMPDSLSWLVSDTNKMLLPLGVLTLMLLAAAIFMHLKRFYLYAGIAAASTLISSLFFPLHIPYYMISLAMIGYGLKLITSLIRQYPLPEEEKDKLKKK